MNKYTKEKRLKLIQRFLEEKEIKNQKEIVSLLKNFGFKVTQATVARDLKELGAVKVKKGGRVFYMIPSEDSERLLRKIILSFKNFVKEIKNVDNLIIIKTPSGNAGGIARLIDEYNIKGVVGTLAGDDTLLVVCEKEKVGEVLDILYSWRER